MLKFSLFEWPEWCLKLFLFFQFYLVPLIVHKWLNSPLSNRLCKLFLVVIVQSPGCVCVGSFCQSVWRRWSVCGRAVSRSVWDKWQVWFQRPTASLWSSVEEGKAWICAAPHRTKQSTGFEAFARSKTTSPTWARKKSWTNILKAIPAEKKC